MSSLHRLLAVVCLAQAPAAFAAKEESLSLFENRRVSVAVPEGCSYSAFKTEDGLATVKISNPSGNIALEVSFLPDPAGQFAAARERAELMVERFQFYVEGSVEKAMQFEELSPQSGAGTYCTFTDSKLVGRKDFPPGEFLHATVGLKTWPGVIAIFTLFSNDPVSPAHQAAMKLLRESMQERPVPLR